MTLGCFQLGILVSGCRGRGHGMIHNVAVLLIAHGIWYATRSSGTVCIGRLIGHPRVLWPVRLLFNLGVVARVQVVLELGRCDHSEASFYPLPLLLLQPALFELLVDGVGN